MFSPASGLSLAQQIAALPPDEREELLADVDMEALQWDWSFWARPNQVPPDDFWIWILSGGRGMGKTVSMTEWIRKKALENPGSRGALVARTAADVRDVIIQGNSGIMARCAPSETPTWEPSKRLVTWPNGSQALAFSSEEPSQLRGPQQHWAACVDADSFVTTPTGPKRIRDVIAGDMVLGSVGFTRVVASGPTGIKPVLTLRAGEAELRATADHRVWTPRGWMELESLSATDIVGHYGARSQNIRHANATGVTASSLRGDQTPFIAHGSVGMTRVTSVRESRSTPTLVWDLTTESHDYCANDILVHNCDELASWRWIVDDSGLNAWDHVRIGTRLGKNPQITVATTPKRAPGFKQLLAEAEVNPKIVVTRGSTRENIGNLSQEYIDTIYGLYEGTALAAQELDGQLLGAVEGALWTPDEIEANRVPSLPSDVMDSGIVVIGVDPSVSETPRDLCGIVVVAGTRSKRLGDRHVYVLEDRSVLGPPSVWSKEVARAAQDYGAVIVAETNQGGALIRDSIAQIDPRLQIKTVHARVGKALRAEPVVLASQQGRVHFVGGIGDLSELSDEMTSWQPEVSKKSPDRLDALVYGALAFLTAEGDRLGVGAGPIRVAVNQEIRSIRGARASRRMQAAVAARDPLAGLPGYMRQSARAFWK